jgi:hypothetical protein
MSLNDLTEFVLRFGASGVRQNFEIVLCLLLIFNESPHNSAKQQRKVIYEDLCCNENRYYLINFISF